LELQKIARQLDELHFQAGPAVQPVARAAVAERPNRQPAPKGETVTYTVDQHLAARSPAIADLFNELARCIRGLGIAVQEIPRRHFVAYRTNRNFCGIIVTSSKLRVHIDIPHARLTDPQGIAADCSTVGHWPTGDTRFDIFSIDAVPYAMNLIQQSFEWSLQTG
jgi:predicted transport protein